MENRPKVKPKLTFIDIITEAAGWIVMTILWIIVIYTYKSFPDTIPVHFDVKGVPDNTGSKLVLFFLPATATLLLTGMTFLNSYPQIFNYPIKINAENALRQYTLATRMIRFLKLALALIFSLVYFSISEAATENTLFSAWYIIPVILLMVFVPLGVYLIQASKHK